MKNTAIKISELGKKYTIRTSFSTPNLHGSFFGRLKSALPFNRRRDALWALRGVSFNVGQGEVIGIIGRNGAGKSTLLKILSRVTEPTEGEVRIRGRVGSLLEVGTGFHPELTGRENIFLKGSIMGMTKIEIQNKFDDIVDFSEIDRFLDLPVKRYSSGMYVRLAFSVAASLLPEILMVDEVLAVGDTGFRKKCIHRMAEIVQSGSTILLVSHNLTEIQMLAKRSIWIDSGRLMMDGPTDDVIQVYGEASEATAGSNQVIEH
jgi:lipopolysaccharide transport system ATP-binding protein